MGGGNSATNQQNALTQAQAQTQTQESALAQQNQAEGLSLMQPLITQLQALSSGSPTAVQTALAPYLTNITQSAAQQKGQIMESTSPGVGRDVALQQVTQNSGNAIASEKNSLIQNAPAQLAQVGAGVEGFGLSQVGAGISAGSAASTSNQAVIQQQEQSKADTMNFLGSLAGAGGSALGSAVGLGGAWGCWIAEAIYGVDDLRTHIVRAYLSGPFAEGVLGGVVMWLYRRFGRVVAGTVKHSAFLKWTLKPLFDWALRSAMSNQVTVDTVLYARS